MRPPDVRSSSRELDAEVEEQEDQPEGCEQLQILRMREQHRPWGVGPGEDARPDEERDRRQSDSATDASEQAGKQEREAENDELATHQRVTWRARCGSGRTTFVRSFSGELPKSQPSGAIAAAALVVRIERQPLNGSRIDSSSACRSERCRRPLRRPSR